MGSQSEKGWRQIRMGMTSLTIHWQKLSSTINASIEKQMVNAASAGKLTIMRNKGGELEP